MELRHLRSFVAVAEEQHFGRAAARLFLSPPALSQQIQALERVLGTPLFERSPRRVELTEAGTVFVVHARAVLAAADRARDAVRPYASGLAGTVAVGIVDEGAAELTAPILAAFRAAYPLVRVQVRSVAYTGRSFETSDVLLGIPVVPGAAPGPGQDARVLFTAGRLAMLPRRHPLAEAVGLGPADLLDEPLVDWPRGPGDLPHWLDGHRGGGPGRVADLVRSMPEMLVSVASGVGVALVTGANARFWPHPGVTYVPVDGPDRVGSAAVLRAGEDRPAVLALAAVAEQVAVEAPVLVPGAAAA